MPPIVQTIGGGSIDWLPYSIFVVIGLALLCLLLTTRLVWGRWLYAVGGSPEAARRASIPTRRVLVTVYVLSGFAAGVAGLLVAGLIDAGSPTAGDLAELDSIAAVIIGGAAFAGGRGNVGNALVGAFTIGVIRNALNLHNVDAFYQLMAIGVVLLAAVEADVLRGYIEGRVRVMQADEARVTTMETPLAGRPAETAPVLSVRGASKRFGAVTALEDLDLDVRRGEVLALLGDNGAGKSTLIKCLNGVHRFDSGTIRMEGEPVSIHEPADARALGIETVYQDLALFDNLRPTDNFYAGRELAGPSWLPRSLRVIKRRQMTETTREVLERLQVTLPDFKATLGLMSGGQRQAVAVSRAAAFASKVVILDEPTAALGVRESRKVLDLILRLRGENRAVLVVSHAMDHVMEIADRAVVLRRGRKVGEVIPSAETHQEIVSMIVGGGE